MANVAISIALRRGLKLLATSSPAASRSDVNIESAPSMYPAKKYCDITGFEAPYTDPRTKLRFASVDVFKRIRFLSDEHIQGYLALRNAAVVLK